MIQIEEIEIVEFRGIRHLKQMLSRKSIGISGPNGTGKSGVVDAIEFALTGNITRLGGAGTAELSVKAHAPHVDSGKKPENALVRLKVYVPSIKKSFTIERSVKGATTPTLTPNNDETKTVLAKLETHPEFALSRREIIKYILTPAGERSKDVQVLLRLEQIEKVRASLQRVANDAKRDAKQAEADDVRTKRDFFQHLGHKVAKKADLLNAVNERRALLKLAPITDLAPPSALKEGVTTEVGKEPIKPTLSKLAAQTDLATYGQCSAAADPALPAKAVAALGKLTSDPALLKAVKQLALVEQGLELLDEDACPLCDTEWEIGKLVSHLKDKVAKASAATAIFEELSAAVEPVLGYLQNAGAAASKIVEWCGKADPEIEAAAMQAYAQSVADDRVIITEVCSQPAVMAEALEALARAGMAPPAATAAVASNLRTYVDGLPDPSKEEAAKEFLIIAQEKYDRCRETQRALDVANKRAGVAAAVFEHYGKVSTGVLEGIYDKVQNDFTAYYSFINRDDEAKFEGKLTPSVGKLAFDVDFYGRGKFPPGAYHSEGHQDSMGLCLYLALVKHTLGEGFTLAVLDDVLMSVDAGHRREVCALLKQKFPDTQFVLTTHDPVWLKFMETEKLIQGKLNFGGWTVDSGPRVWSEDDVWKLIEGQLAKNDVGGAAGTLRRYLEFVSTILADNFRARVEYHGNGQYDLGDLFPAVIAAWKARLQEVRDSAASWGKNTNDAEALVADAKEKIAATKSEEWMINKAVHYNAWANMQPKEFASVASAHQALLKSMQCPNPKCGEFVYVSPSKGDREALRCGCGTTNLNLLPKNKK